MCIQDMIVKLDSPKQTIVIEAGTSKRKVETKAYLCKMFLHEVKKLSADNIKITVDDESFDDLIQHLGQ